MTSSLYHTPCLAVRYLQHLSLPALFCRPVWSQLVPDCPMRRAHSKVVSTGIQCLFWGRGDWSREPTHVKSRRAFLIGAGCFCLWEQGVNRRSESVNLWDWCRRVLEETAAGTTEIGRGLGGRPLSQAPTDVPEPDLNTLGSLGVGVIPRNFHWGLSHCERSSQCLGNLLP